MSRRDMTQNGIDARINFNERFFEAGLIALFLNDCAISASRKKQQRDRENASRHARRYRHPRRHPSRSRTQFGIKRSRER